MPVASGRWHFYSRKVSKESLVKIGYVMKTHGLKGEVTAMLSSGSPTISIQDILTLELKSGLVPYLVQNISVHGEKVFVKFESVDSIEQSDLLRGCSIFLEKTKRPKLKRGEFYDDEINGFEVWDKVHGSLGQVTQIINQGPSRLLEIGIKGILIPTNGPFIKSISKASKRIEVDLPEGYLEI